MKVEITILLDKTLYDDLCGCANDNDQTLDELMEEIINFWYDY